LIYPAHFEEKIAFSKIREMLLENCLCEAGARLVHLMNFISDQEVLLPIWQQSFEFKQLMLFETGFPASNYFDLSEVLTYLRVDGSSIKIEELFELHLSLKTILLIHDYLQKRAESYPVLASLNSLIYFDKNLVSNMEAIIDERGRIRDTASEKLLEIRLRMRKLQSSMRNKIQQSLQLSKSKGWSKDDAEVTIRNGRSVIPVLAAEKRQLKGFVHDESRTGQLVYIEPIELFETNNELRELEMDELQEINRILLQFAYQLRPDIDALQEAYQYLGIIDFNRAKAKLAMDIDAHLPILSTDNQMNWMQARHPILLISHRQKGKNIIPLDLELTPQGRILIISGPNAGGKSVCLKTVGLLQYMFQCGLLVPMRQNSEMRLFNHLLIDIGDQQSIENDLSTYSSHLLNLRHFLQYSDAESLFLIDELGTGTEPAIGGAIAEAALEQLNDAKAFGVVTTHYGNLKALAGKVEGIVNGAMLFDTRELRPLYRLKIGQPGSSFAFEIARKMGIEEQLLQRASTKSGRKEVNFDQRLQEVELEKERLDLKAKELEFTDNALKELVEKYNAMNEKLQLEKNMLMHEARAKAKEIIKDANRLVEKTIREIKESEANKEKVKELRTTLESTHNELVDKVLEKPELPKVVTTKTKVIDEVKVLAESPLLEDMVRLIGQQTVGKLEQIKGKNAVISFDSIRVTVPYLQLEKVQVNKNQALKQSSNTQYSSILQNIHERSLQFKPSIDLRGKRAEETLNFVKSWLDEAMLLSQKDLEILHGTGNGILRQVIRDYLSSVKQVERFSDASLEMGGGGKTLIKLR